MFAKKIINLQNFCFVNIFSPSPSVLVECLDALLALSVPHPHCLVVTARHNQSAVRTELCTPHPIAVTAQSKLKFLSVHSPHLQKKKSHISLVMLIGQTVGETILEYLY